jgi:hypothetical protein
MDRVDRITFARLAAPKRLDPDLLRRQHRLLPAPTVQAQVLLTLHQLAESLRDPLRLVWLEPASEAA